MKLELREIVSAMVGQSDPVVDLQGFPQVGVTLLAQRIPLRDALEEMHLIDAGTGPVRAPGAKPQARLVNATSTVVALAAAQVPLPMQRPDVTQRR